MPRPAPDPDRITPMWMAHHFPEDYDRCVLVGRNHVCRRCLALYPVAFAVLALCLGLGAPDRLTAWLLVLLPLPAVVEFILEHTGVLTYRPVRQVVVSVLLGVGLGAGFARYLDDQTDRLFWLVVLVDGGVCVAAWWFGNRRPADGS